jgi:tryptophan synthase alpha chain
MKSLTRKPVCVGFGVSNPGQARNVAAAADGVIVGSAIIKVIEKNLKSASLVAKVSKFAGSLAKAIHNA